MDVFYVAYYVEKELNIEAFNNKANLTEFVNGLKQKDIEHKVVKVKNNASLKNFIDYISENKLSEAYHQMMQRAK